MDFKVKCVRVEPDDTDFTKGKTYNVVNGKLIDNHGRVFEAWSLPRNGCGDFAALKKWFERWCDFELVEGTKVFTKNDLKTGMFGVMDNGFKFVVVDDRLIYSNGEWDKVSSLNDKLEMYSKKIMTVYDRTTVCSFNILDYAIISNLFNPVYDRERDTKPLYNGKVVCLDNTFNSNYTVGKIYQFKDGQITADNGKRYPMDNTNPSKNTAKIYNFEDWKNWSTAKWLEIKE